MPNSDPKTPAPKEDRVKGSKTNSKGSASSGKSKAVKFSAKTETSLKNKVICLILNLHKMYSRQLKTLHVLPFLRFKSQLTRDISDTLKVSSTYQKLNNK
jgi:hypothetical protein